MQYDELKFQKCCEKSGNSGIYYYEGVEKVEPPLGAAVDMKGDESTVNT